MMLPGVGVKKELCRTFAISLFYAIFFYFFQFFLYKLGYVANIPDEQNLLIFDATHYMGIAINGYVYWNAGNNTAFFILFPWLWKLLHVGVIGISIVNVILFSLGFAILSAICKFTDIEKVLLLSMPSIFFCYIPYSEALFFIEIALVFRGIITNRKYLTWLFLFLAALTKATTLFLIPAFLIMELMTNDKALWPQALRGYVMYYLLPIIAGLSVFIVYQYLVVGIWFVYFSQQSEYWGHVFSMPSLPFDSTTGPRTLWLNAFALFAALMALIVFLIKVLLWVLKRKETKDRLLIVSTCYLGITLFYGIFFNPKWASNHTIIWAMHRYVFATPFFFVFAHYCFRDLRSNWKHYIGIVLLANIVWLCCGSYLHIQNFIFFNFITLYVVMFLFYANKKLSWLALFLMVINFTMQMNLMQQAIAGLYPE